MGQFMEYSKRRNLNRGYMKLEVWQRAMDLSEMAFRLAATVSDFNQWQDSLPDRSKNPTIHSSKYPPQPARQ